MAAIVSRLKNGKMFLNSNENVLLLITLNEIHKTTNKLISFLAVHNSSIGDLVTHSLTHSLTEGTFTFDITE